MRPYSWNPWGNVWTGSIARPDQVLRQLEYAKDAGWAWAYIYRLTKTPSSRLVLQTGDVWDAPGWDNASIFADAYKALRALGMPDGTYVDAEFNPIEWSPVSEQPQPAPIPGTTLTTKPPKPVGPAVVPGTAPVTTPPPPAPTTTTAGGGMLLPLLAVGAAVLLLTRK